MAANPNDMHDKLAGEFSKLSDNESAVTSAMALLRTWLEQKLYEPFKSPIIAQIDQAKYTLLLDSFYQLVPFGTGGRRARVGYGPNRINPCTVAVSVQGHCDYLQQYPPESRSKSVVVAFDTRIFRDIAGTYDFLGSSHPLLGLTSRSLAFDACEIYAANGFTVFIADQESTRPFLSTPELSFSIRHLSAAGGINVSASHNHPDDNGFKFYNDRGAQDIPPTDEHLASFMNGVKEIHRIPFDAAFKQGKIRTIPPEVHDAYLETNLNLASRSGSRAIKVVYTPLCGTGNSTVGEVLRSAGVDLHLYGPQAEFDGTFSSVPFRLPNPEVSQSANPALNLADEIGADIVMSTDPDADRIGVFARDNSRKWRYLSGNDIASIIAYYLVLDKRGPKRSGIIIKTLVTTSTLAAIARSSGCGLVGDLLVGFKYVANVLERLERDGRYQNIKGRAEDLVLAAEESHGVLLTPKIRDKDAAGGALILTELAGLLYSEGSSIPEYLDSVIMECGNCALLSRSLVRRGIAGAEAIAVLMQSLRNDPPARLGAYPVVDVADYLSTGRFGPLPSETAKASRNLLAYQLPGARVIIRPSGTEPKAKVYVEIEGRSVVPTGDGNAARSAANELASAVFTECTDRMGIKLSSAAQLLPDHIDLELKASFDTSFRSELASSANYLSTVDAGERAAWLRQHLSAYGGGVDPLEQTGAAVAMLSRELAQGPLSKAAAETFQEIADLCSLGTKPSGNR